MDQTLQNKTFRLAERPEGAPDERTFRLGLEPVPELPKGCVRIAVEYISLDPAMRTWIDDIESYFPPVVVGEVMRSGAAGTVIASDVPSLKVGDTVQGMMGVQSIYTGPADNLTRIETDQASVPDYMGGLGGTGLAAYFGILRVGEYKTDDTVVVSAAAGAVGHVAVQIAKLKGSRVIGIAGGAEKCRRVVEEYGADSCIDYKSQDISARLGELCPEGIDLYLDNVGGTTLEAVLDNLAFDARIAISGAIGEYDNLSSVHGPSNYLNLIAKRGTMRGLLNIHWAKEFGEAREEMMRWMEQGKLRFDTQIEEGFENFPEVFSMLFAGRNTGKLLLKI